MFTVDADITDLKVREKDLFKVYFSMNTHHAAAPDMSLEEARSYVFFFREGREKISSFIGLHFLNSDRKLFYTYSGNPFPESQLQDVEAEAKNFAEDLGSMLDEIDLSKVSSSEKARWIDEQEIFKKKSSETPTSGRTAAPASTPNGSKPNQAVQPAPADRQTPPPPKAASEPSVRQPSGASAIAPTALDPVAPMPAVQPQAKRAAADSAPPLQPGQSAQTNENRQPAVPRPARTQKKASPAAPGTSPSAAAPEPEQPSALPGNDVFEQAVKAGIVKVPKAQFRKEVRAATGALSRDKEALARLLSSF